MWYPKTKEEAKKIKYEDWAGNPNGVPYKEGRCVYAIFKGVTEFQCQRKNGFGPDGLYCRQHAKKLEKWKNSNE
ncbi:MAG: hypothetical protein QW156_04695 [Candidatus Aenigmatarchaeota archaeon]